MSDIAPNEVVIDDDNYQQFLPENMSEVGFGLVPRDYSAIPVGSIEGIAKFQDDIIPPSEWPSRIRDIEQSDSSLSAMFNRGNVGQAIPHLDQNGQGYCWAYSPASAMMLARARDNQPYVRLSAHAVAAKIKNFRDQGGWNPLAVEFAIKNGYPSVQAWPEKSMRREHDNAATWADAAKYKITEGWMDLQPSIYDRNLTFQQLATCLLQRIPCPVDFNWWGHSVCAADLLELDSSLPLSDINRWGIRILNSWKGWGVNSFGVLKGNRAVPNGATAIKVTT